MFLTLGVTTRPTFTPSFGSRPTSDHAWILPTPSQTPTGVVGSVGAFSSGMNPTADVRIRKAEMGLDAFGSGSAASIGDLGTVGTRFVRLADGIGNGSGAADLPAYWSVLVHERGMSRPKTSM